MDNATFDPGPLAQTDLVASGADLAGAAGLASSLLAPGEDRWTLVFVRDLRHPPEKVWAALTDPAKLRDWAPFTTDRDLSATGDATLTMVDGETTEDLPVTVLRAEPPTLLEYTWGTDLLRWELAPTGAGTRLTLRHTITDRDWAPKVAAGWHLCLVVAGHLLDGRPIAPIRGQDALNYGWQALADSYAAKLPPATP